MTAREVEYRRLRADICNKLGWYELLAFVGMPSAALFIISVGFGWFVLVSALLFSEYWWVAIFLVVTPLVSMGTDKPVSDLKAQLKSLERNYNLGQPLIAIIKPTALAVKGTTDDQAKRLAEWCSEKQLNLTGDSVEQPA